MKFFILYLAHGTIYILRTNSLEVHRKNVHKQVYTVSLELCDIQVTAHTEFACASQLDMSPRQPHLLFFLEVGHKIAHTKETKRYLALGYPDYGTSRTGA